MKLYSAVLAISCLTALAACETTAPSENAASVANLNVSFSWDETAKCFDPQSPKFVVLGVPAGTTALDFRMTDLDAPSFNHGGGRVAFSGPTVSQGAFTYKGPCPPSGSHDYQWDVKALDASDTVLARGTATAPFSQSGR